MPHGPQAQLGETSNLRDAKQVLEISNSLRTQPISYKSFTHPNSTNLTNDKYRLLYALPCQGKLDRFRHAGNLPICQDAYERHEIVLKGIIGRRSASAVPRVSLNNDHGVNGAYGSCATETWNTERT